MNKIQTMKSIILFALAFILTTTCSFGQLSIGTGVTTPVGSFANIENGAADLGYQLIASYDISANQNYGISTGLLIGQTSLNDNSTKFNKGHWSYLLVEVGGYVQLFDNLKIKGLISTGSFATPEFNIENGTVVLNKLGVGIDLKLEYAFRKFYIGSNFIYSKPEFESFSTNPIRQSISNVGLIIGYTF